jgi:hypothetical protein
MSLNEDLESLKKATKELQTFYQKVDKEIGDLEEAIRYINPGVAASVDTDESFSIGWSFDSNRGWRITFLQSGYNETNLLSKDELTKIRAIRHLPKLVKQLTANVKLRLLEAVNCLQGLL